MENDLHLLQIYLLRETLTRHWADRHDFFAGGNMFFYFSPAQLKSEHFRGPDFFVAVGVDGKRQRKSWVTWEEGKVPDVIFEFLSETTADFDKGGKKLIYQNQARVPEYFWYDFESGEFAGFALREGEYQPLEPDERGRLVSAALGLALARWEGKYMRMTTTWLRWETIDGKLLPTDSEAAERAEARARRERQRARQEHERAERERQRAELFLARLRELGVDPDSLK
jgi:Uma2 family endonuclease